MPTYALISSKIPIKKVAASVLSLSKKVAVFKTKKLTKLTKGSKLVRIFQEYAPPKGFRIEELTPEMYERAPGVEEIKALIVDKVFKTQTPNLKTQNLLFGLSFYDFDYLRANFVNRLGKKIKDELKNQGIKTKFISVGTKPYLSKRKAKKLSKEGLEIVIIKKSSPPLAIYLGKVVKLI